MERIRPVDIERVTIPTKFRGLDKVAVKDLIGRCSKEIEQLLGELKESREESERLRAEVEGFRAQESTLKEALLLAQRTADETKANAHREADLIIEEARRKATDLQRELETKLNDVRWDLERARLEKQTFIAGFRAMLEDHMRNLNEAEPRLAVVEGTSAIETGS